MRERLVVTLVSMTVGTLLLFGVVRAYSTADLVRDHQDTLVSHAADVAAVAIAARESDQPPVTPSFLSSLAYPKQAIAYTDGAGTTIRSGTIDRDDDDVTATRSVEGGGRVVVTQAASVGSERVSDALLPLVLLALGLSTLAAIIGSLLARRFAYPFRKLADDAIRIGDGHFDVDVHHSYIREAADLGNALRRAAAQLDSLVRRERELAVVASHELRTPITALRLSLEDLTLWPQTPPEVAEELQHSLAEVDRLSGVVTRLLERGDEGHLGAAADVDLRTIAASGVDRWAERARAQGRQIVLAPSEPTMTRIVRAPVDQVVDVLIENALAHGVGTVTVDVVTLGPYLAIRVADESPRAFETGALHVSPAGPEAGLTRAATHAESLGGFVAVGDADTTRVSLVLPHPDAPRADAPGPDAPGPDAPGGGA